jgi:hypothetical protein
MNFKLIATIFITYFMFLITHNKKNIYILFCKCIIRTMMMYRIMRRKCVTCWGVN